MKCVFGFTPNPECGNCGGTGVISEPDEPCLFCEEDGIVNGEVDGCFQQTGKLAELLPAQPQYCLLSNGDRYARFGLDGGSGDVSGLLVFANVEQVGQFTLTNPSRADQFVSMNGLGLSEFQPLMVAAEDLLPILMAHGGRMCVPYRLGEMVATVSGLDHLHRHCAALPPGPVADVPAVERLLAACWGDLVGDDGGMVAHKLVGRMKIVTWNSPILIFRIDRHGSLAMGGTRDDLQHWHVDVNKGTATLVKIGWRQNKPQSAPFQVKATAAEVTEAIRSGQEHDRLQWDGPNKVKLKTTKLFPEGSGYRRTVEGQRKRFRSYVAEALIAEGWRRLGNDLFERQG